MNMKEKDIVDFTKMKKNEEDEYIDSEGNEVGCRICYTHAKACYYFENLDHFQNADMSAVSFAMTVHGLMDYELDLRSGGCEKENQERKALDEYLQWFCQENAVK